MLSQWLNKETVHIVESIDDWKAAIRLSAVPLIEKEIITAKYVQAIYHLHESIGPYYVLAPGIAMPHARPEEGVNKLGLSMLLVKNGVKFNSETNDPVYLVTMLAAPDSDSHVDMLTQLAEIFGAEEDMQTIFNAKSVEEILAITNKY